MIKGVIFDLDGVLVSTDKLHYKSWKKLANEIGIANYSLKDNMKQRGVSRKDSLEILLQKSSKLYSLEEKEMLLGRKNRYYQELLLESEDNILLSGSIKALHYLRQRSLKLSIGSSSKNAPQIIKKAGLERYIDACVCGLDITHAKPDPEIFLKAAEAIKIERNLCLVVEDSEAGVEAAKQAGMRTLGIGCYFNKLRADYMAKDLEAIDNWEKILE